MAPLRELRVLVTRALYLIERLAIASAEPVLLRWYTEHADWLRETGGRVAIAPLSPMPKRERLNLSALSQEIEQLQTKTEELKKQHPEWRNW